MSQLISQAQEGFTNLYESLPNALPGDDNEPEVEQSEFTIDGVDGNKIIIYVWRQKNASSERLPGIVYIHGGESSYEVDPGWCLRFLSQ